MSGPGRSSQRDFFDSEDDTQDIVDDSESRGADAVGVASPVPEEPPIPLEQDMSPELPLADNVRLYSTLNRAQEMDACDWLKDNEILYNKKLSAYRDKHKKDAVSEKIDFVCACIHILFVPTPYGMLYFQILKK